MDNYLKKIREEKGLTVIELSKLTGIKRDTIYKMENCKTGISKNNMIKIEKALNVTSSQIYGGASILMSLKFYSDVKKLADPDNSLSYDLIGVSQKLLNILLVQDYKSIIILRAFEKNMEPTISNNDFLLIDSKNKDILNNKIYLIKENDNFKLKRILRESPFDQKIVIKSENQVDGEYPPYQVSIEKAKEMILGQVVFYGRSIL